jgi:RNA polymerase sigma-70 factor, ECF subfamily
MTTTAAMTVDGAEAAADGTDRTILALWPTAYRIARLILRDDMAAEDVAQESCVRALQRRSQLRDDAALAPWFRSLVTHLALSARRRAERRRKRETPVEEHFDAASTSSDSAATLDLAAALERLDDSLRLPLVLVYHGGFTSVEVGRYLSIAPATVRYRLAVARNTLRPLLETTDHA